MTVGDNSARYGRGHNPDKAATMPDGMHLLKGALRADQLPDYATSSDLFRSFVGVGDQGQTSRCWGYTHREALGVYAAGQLGLYDLLSANSAYYSARAMLRKLELEVGGHVMTRADVLANPLTDSGSEPTAGVLGLATTGIASEAAWPSSADPDQMNAEEDLGEAEDADQRTLIVSSFGAISAAPGKDRILAVRQALAPFADGTRGRAVPASWATSTASFESCNGSRVLTAADFGPVGAWDHSMGMFAYRPSAAIAGEYEFLVSNHWGKAWGALCMDYVMTPTPAAQPLGQLVAMPGCAWVSEDAVNAAADLFLMNAVKKTLARKS